MAKCVLVVDNSNIFIEGQKHSAAKKGVQKQHPEEREPCDPSWRINFGELLVRLAEGRDIHAAILVGSRPPQNDGVWKSAKELGFSVTVHDRDSQHREKAVDTELVAQGTETICSAPEPMTLVIASGDRDFIPLVSVAHRRKWTVEMAAFSSAFSATGDMATTVDKVRPLEEMFDKIGYNAFKWPM
ncbi:MAG: NYN domain-containing protein [Terriglobales bacterium]